MTESTHNGKNVLSVGIPAPCIECVPEAMKPVFEMGMKLQADCLELCGHRARAWLEWPEKFMTCKNLDDLTRAQGEYVAKMQHNYAHFFDGILHHTMIEQDELEEDEDGTQAMPEATPLHREAA